MSVVSKLKIELLSNPGLYAAMSDAEVVTELNLLQFSSEGGVADLMLYLLENKNKSNAGADLVVTPILGRLHHVAEAVVGVDPFDSGVVVTLEGKHVAQSFLDLLANPHLEAVDFTSVNLDFGSLKDMEILKQGDVDTLTAISSNKASRAMQLGISPIRIGHVEQARAL